MPRALFFFCAAFLCRAVPLAAQPALAGCRTLPADNVWNTPADNLPLDPNSDRYVATIGSTRPAHADFGAGQFQGGPIGIPFIVVPGTQAKVPISFQYADESEPGPYPIPADAPIEGGPNSQGDRHILIVDRDNCKLYEIFSAYPHGDGSWRAGSGAIFDLRSNRLRPPGWTSADAAGLPILPGLVRYDEVAAGEIRHAIRFTVPQTRRAYVWPGRHFASSLTGIQYPPMGQRFRLKATFDVSGFSADTQVILRALKKYGMILADNGSAWFLSGVPDNRWNNDHLAELRRVTGAGFEAVDQSPLMGDPDSGQAKAGRPSVAAVVNGASFLGGAISAGAIITIFGAGLGPLLASALRLTSAGAVDTQLGGARVLFDGIPAPLLYVSAGQVSAVAPYGIGGDVTRCELEFLGLRSEAKQIPVTAAAPALFTLNASGLGQVAAVNQDGTINTSSNPAPRGSILSLYATGEGQTSPAGIDGKLAVEPLPQPLARVTVTIGGVTADVQYVGGAPGLVAGVMQVNAKVPEGAPAGPEVSVVVKAGSAPSQPGVTLAIR